MSLSTICVVGIDSTDAEVLNGLSAVWAYMEGNNDSYIKFDIERLESIDKNGQLTHMVWDAENCKYDHLPISLKPFIDYVLNEGVDRNRPFLIFNSW